MWAVGIRKRDCFVLLDSHRLHRYHFPVTLFLVWRTFNPCYTPASTRGGFLCVGHMRRGGYQRGGQPDYVRFLVSHL